jgi:hypothetical protein
LLNQAHGVHDAAPLGRRQVPKHDGHFVACQLLERRKCGLPASGQGKMRLTRVGVRGRPRDEPAALEALQDAAQIPAVEFQDLRHVGGGRLDRARRSGIAVVPDLKEHAPFGQRKRALEQLLLQHANLARVEAIEAANRVDVLGKSESSHGGSPAGMAAEAPSIDPIVD